MKFYEFEKKYPFWNIYLFFAWLIFKISYFFIFLPNKYLGCFLDFLDSNSFMYIRILLAILTFIAFLLFSKKLIYTLLNNNIFQVLLVGMFTLFNFLLCQKEKFRVNTVRIFSLKLEKLSFFVFPNVDYFILLFFFVNFFVRFNKIILIPFLRFDLASLDFSEKEHFYWFDICQLLSFGFERDSHGSFDVEKIYSPRFPIKNQLEHPFFISSFLYLPLKQKAFKKLVEVDDLFKAAKNILFINFEKKTQEERKTAILKYQDFVDVRNRKILKACKQIRKFAFKVNEFVFKSCLQGLFIAYLISMLILNLHFF